MSTMTAAPATKKEARNRLIEGLPPVESRRLSAHLERSFLRRDTKLFEQGKPIRKVYFPLTAVLSLITTLSDGTTIEISTVGNEGTTGVPTFLGEKVVTNAACICQIAGETLCMEAHDFREVLDSSSHLHDVVARYVGALLTQVGQAVACNALHTTLQRAARWLLTSHDRVDKDQFMLTQEFLSYMLGSKRASVNKAARKLADEGLITYKRGLITITDRKGLESQSCECYFVMRDALEQAIGKDRS